MRKALLLALPILAAGLIVPAMAADAPAGNSTVVVAQNGDGGFTINRDPANQTPYSLAGNTLVIAPIGTNGPDKFTAELAYGQLAAADLRSTSFDFKVTNNAAAAGSADDFYFNVGVALPGTGTTFYDCRYDYNAPLGSTTQFTTATATPQNLDLGRVRGTYGPLCPQNFDELPVGSLINFIAFNVGQANDTDAGLGAELDNVVVSTVNGTTTYDLGTPPRVLSKENCKNGGFATEFTPAFKNQGACVSSFAAAK
jgi:hypothetical protein